LSAAERKYLVVAVFCVLLALFARLLFWPSAVKLSEIDDSIVKEKNLIRQNLHFLSYKDRIEKEAGSLKDYFTTEVKTEEQVIAEFLRNIELLGTRSDIQISKISPAGQDYQKEFIKYFVSVDCAGSLANVTKFIYAVNNSPELLKVEKMNLGGNAKTSDSVQVSLTISKMIVGADPAVPAGNFVRVKEKSAPSQDQLPQ
jgi:Tfp pilus assembly protein PilO